MSYTNPLFPTEASPLPSSIMTGPGNPTRGSSVKLASLVRDHVLPNPSAEITNRSMHQIQLELEYDAEESDNDSEKGPSIQSWPGGLERHASDHADDILGDQATREMHALCIFDDIVLPPSARPWTPLLEDLSRAPTVRRWGRWRWREEPAFGDPRVAESIMMYERGVEQSTNDRRCSRCRAGQGISPQCVVAPDAGAGCSNCHYDGVGGVCNASGIRTPASGCRERGSEATRDPDKVIDHMAVLEMIAQLKRPSGTRRDHSLPERARRIEAAALQIAQAARDWREKMTKDMDGDR
ncbi:hypothetical protein ESCO_000337 [Escovopsis weberi]|uniref:Uncharacterized protein n=1 Tax=Escovopsis weberi TaxID=150374 RepID=A0A0M9VTX4_ESCWE|nr:hypothetical protein ESCO_000337 [Escovopsis weberi]